MRLHCIYGDGYGREHLHVSTDVDMCLNEEVIVIF